MSDIDNLFQEGSQAASRGYPHSSCWVSLWSTFVDSLPPDSNAVTIATCLVILPLGGCAPHSCGRASRPSTLDLHSGLDSMYFQYRTVSHFPTKVRKNRKDAFLADRGLETT